MAIGQGNLFRPGPELVNDDANRTYEERPEIGAFVFLEDAEDEDEELEGVVPRDGRESSHAANDGKVVAIVSRGQSVGAFSCFVG